MRLKKQPQLVTEILEATKFLPLEAGQSERINCILHGIKCVQTCEVCIRPVKFANGKYKRFCSQKCSANSENTRLKCIETSIKTYGCENVFQAKSVRAKIANTNMFRHGVTNTWLLKRNNNFSVIANDLFEHVERYIEGAAFYGVNERLVKTPIGSFKLDFLYETRGTLKAIEFFGDYWHANPKLYDASDSIKGQSVKGIWDKDSRRLSAIRALGIDVLVVWEQDFKEDPEEILNECVYFLRMTE